MTQFGPNADRQPVLTRFQNNAYFMLIFGIIETFLFGWTIWGWPNTIQKRIRFSKSRIPRFKTDFFGLKLWFFIENLIPSKIINDEFFSDCQTSENDVDFNITQLDRCNDKTSLLTGFFTTGACSYLVSAIIGGIIMGKYRSTHEWTRKWSKFISTKKAFIPGGFWGSDNFGWSGRWLVDNLVRVHFLLKNSDRIIKQSTFR